MTPTATTTAVSTVPRRSGKCTEATVSKQRGKPLRASFSHHITSQPYHRLSDQVIQQKKRKAKRMMSISAGRRQLTADVESGMVTMASDEDAAVPSLYSAVVPLSSEKQVALHENLKGCVEWNYDAASCFDLADGNGVVFITRYLLQGVLDLPAKLSINMPKLDRFLLKKRIRGAGGWYRLI